MKYEHGGLDQLDPNPSKLDQHGSFDRRKNCAPRHIAPDPETPLSPAFVNEQGPRIGAELDRSSASPQSADLRNEMAHLKRRIQSMTEMFGRMEVERRETMMEVENLRREVALSKRRRGQGSKSLAVVLLDFELDMFDSALFRRPDEAGRNAARGLRNKVRSYLPAERAGCSVMVYIFLSRDSQLVADMCAEGVISSERELDEFVASFNKAHPLFLLVSSDAPRNETLQRLRDLDHQGLAALYSRLDSCSSLILGRWALDLECANMICSGPSTSEETPRYLKKISFVEPVVGTWVPPELIQRSPVILDTSGLLRKTLLRRNKGAVRGLKLDEYRVSPYRMALMATRAELRMGRMGLQSLLDQAPPICLQHYLGELPCALDSCAFSHAYTIPKDKLDTLRHSLLSTPCAQILQGTECALADGCFFAHVCPRGLSCSRQGCAFPNFMHPDLSTVVVPRLRTPLTKPTTDPGKEAPWPQFVKRAELRLPRSSFVVKLKESKEKIQSQAISSIMPHLSKSHYSVLPDSSVTDSLVVAPAPLKSSKPSLIQPSSSKTIDRIKSGDNINRAAIQRLGIQTLSNEGHGPGSKSGRAGGPKWWQVR
ncbi:BZ3500_MvSof-1268-A1-R1_Chr4-3g07373 [Microbotryum saponariae]|uniref:BZ3500_MvSof-1268-A1-R1_Chr4-3g07373 protein n=1 Tax=Microbotryum saponariae TaxID=289078 RepID=A0A2X0NLL0_9BASI|nr:BZ3500_MvSof-1268-A1-R1_Chr4-3g07373 [Microbotryum saponariae]SDA07036.1 BZ3501_MvSof-1269-A2-R1_Chr4-2g07082 [Microbotryum saponariae]